MKLLNLHKYRPGDRLQNIRVPSRIHVVKRCCTQSGLRAYLFEFDSEKCILGEQYLAENYRRIGNETA